jgi:hypothetical protein
LLFNLSRKSLLPSENSSASPADVIVAGAITGGNATSGAITGGNVAVSVGLLGIAVVTIAVATGFWTNDIGTCPLCFRAKLSASQTNNEASSFCGNNVSSYKTASPPTTRPA